MTDNGPGVMFRFPLSEQNITYADFGARVLKRYWAQGLELQTMSSSAEVYGQPCTL
jgi:hypothetical protein